MALTDSLVSYWQLSEASGSRADSHGSNTLTDNNTVGANTGLVYANAADFIPSSNEYLSITDNAGLSGGDRDFTLAAWVRPDDLALAYNVAGKGDGGGYEYGLLIEQSFQRWRFKVASATAEANAATVEDGGGFGGGNNLATGTWYLLIGWHDSVNNQIGIATSSNSLTAYTASYSAGVWDSTGDFNIGRISSYFPVYFDGRIGPVMFWSRVLSGAEHTQLYNSGAGLTYAAFSGGGGGSSTNLFYRRRR